MAETAKTVYGGKVIIASRPLAKQGTDAGLKFAFETTHNYKKSRDSKATATKSGTVNAQGTLETTLKVEMVANDGDVIKMQEAAMNSGEKMEYWRIFTGVQGSAQGTVKATYMQGTVTSFEEDADADAFSTASVEVAVDGIPVDGEVTFDASTTDSQYGFTGIEKVTTPPAGQ